MFTGDDIAMNIEAITDAARSTDLCGHSFQYVSPASSVPLRGRSLCTPMDSAPAELMDNAATVTTAGPTDEICESVLLSAAGPRETSTGQASCSTPRTKHLLLCNESYVC